MSKAETDMVDIAVGYRPDGDGGLIARDAVRVGYGELPKRFLDIVGCLVLLTVFAVPMAVICMLIRLSGGPILFRQRRIGRSGEVFSCWKFRTMVPDAQQALQRVLDADPAARAEWQRDQKLRDDPRVTRIGNFLRRTSLDELPQLLNVLRGEMSLVGPRPVVKDELVRYGSRARYYLSVKPGLTGLWQISGRNDTSYSRRVALDVFYVKNGSLQFDIWILWRTVGVVLCGFGAY